MEQGSLLAVIPMELARKEVVVYSDNPADQLERQFLNSYRYPRVGSLVSNADEARTLEIYVTLLINKLYNEVNDFSTDYESKKIIENTITHDIFHQFGFLSIKDIELCFYLGARNQFSMKIFVKDGTSNISVTMINSWFQEFCMLRKEKLSKQKQFEQAETDKKALESKTSGAERLKIFENYLNSINEAYKGDFNFSSFGSGNIYTYQFFKEIGLLTEYITTEKTKKAFAEAKEGLQRHYKNEMYGRNKREAKSKRDILKTLPNNYPAINKAFDLNSNKEVSLIVNEIVIEAKNILLVQYLRQCRADKVDLIDSIKKAIKKTGYKI